MEFQTNFKFLKVQELLRKNTESEEQKTFFKLDLIDNSNNVCSFFIFDKDLKLKIINYNFKDFEDVLVIINLSYTNNRWNVNIRDIDKR